MKLRLLLMSDDKPTTSTKKTCIKLLKGKDEFT
jgi:hypothetical protein